MNKDKYIFLTNGLSFREAEIAELAILGLMNKDIGNKLFVCEKTVRYHLTNIYKKLHVKNKPQLILWHATIKRALHDNTDIIDN